MNMKFARFFTPLLATLLLVAAFAASTTNVVAQELTAAPEATAEANNGEPEALAPGETANDADADGTNTPAGEDASDEAAGDEAGSTLVHGSKALPAGAAADSGGISPLAIAALLIGLFVLPVLIGAQRLSAMVTRPHTADLIEKITDHQVPEVHWEETVVTSRSPLVGKAIGEALSQSGFKILIVGIRRSNGEITFNPTSVDTFKAEDVLIIMGSNSEIGKFLKAFSLLSSGTL